ncbi:MAG: FkbM family methyltransferase [Pseudomonadota bacterium]|nr:FkbM family methyltransferase [Pseudomonadota bacterium]
MIKYAAKLPILKRIVPSIIKRLNLKGYIYTYNNIKFRLDLKYLVDRRFFLHGYDEDVIEHINTFCKSKNCNYFLDIGSCWGLYSLQVANANPDLQVYAFDVFKSNINRLQEMANSNDINNIKTFNYAIGSEEKMAVFSVNEKHSPNFAKDLNGTFKINVPQNSIDNLVNISNSKIVIKMDIERSELEALKGSEKLLKKNKCLIVLETTNHKALNYLSSLDFKIIEHKLKTSDYLLSNF